MKRRILYTTFIFLIFINKIISQENSYSTKFIYNTEIISNNGEVLEEKMTLFYSKNESIYTSPIKLILDSLKVNYRKQGDIYGYQDEKAKYPKNRMKYIILKDDNKYRYQVSSGLNIIEFEDEIPKFKWEIKNKIDTVLNYKVQLATTTYNGNNYEAWFSTEIPINNGPYYFNGLPGLILKIKNLNLNYTIKLIGVENKNGELPKLSTKKIIKINQNELYQTILGTIRGLTETMDKESKKKVMDKGYDLVDKKYLYEF